MTTKTVSIEVLRLDLNHPLTESQSAQLGAGRKSENRLDGAMSIGRGLRVEGSYRWYRQVAGLMDSIAELSSR